MITHYDMITGEVIASERPDQAATAGPGITLPVPRLMTLQEAAIAIPRRFSPHRQDAVVMQPIAILCKAQE